MRIRKTKKRRGREGRDERIRGKRIGNRREAIREKEAKLEQNMREKKDKKNKSRTRGR
jgi:hypothetical protein